MEDQDQSERKSSTASKLLRLQVSQILFFDTKARNFITIYPDKVLDKNSKNAVASAAKELRRNYAKRVIDKLAMLTKNSLKILGLESKMSLLLSLISFFCRVVGLIKSWSQICTDERLGVASNAIR